MTDQLAAVLLATLRELVHEEIERDREILYAELERERRVVA